MVKKKRKYKSDHKKITRKLELFFTYLIKTWEIGGKRQLN